MRLLKRTYTLPPDTLEQFEQVVAVGKRSAVITELLREWLDGQRREQLRREIIEGCREMADVYLETEREYHPLEEEIHRGLDA
jgi:metal-responsive CopG/Arc/MetJ family transcriptional regulator